MHSFTWNMVNLLKCIFLTCPFLMTHPRSSYANSLKSFHAVSTDTKQMDLKAILEDAEPGFDLTDDEISKFKMWPQGIIPYFIDNYSFDEATRGRIRGYLEAVNIETGLHFLELDSPPHDEQIRWVLFVNRRNQLDCDDISIKQFTNDGVQRVVLGYDCINGRGIAEIVLALAGVPAQHNAPNRDYYVVIQSENIIPDKKHFFEALKDNEWLFHDIQYDFSSASHYDFHKYTVNGQSTIKPVRSVMVPFEETGGFSYSDVWKIRMLYNCILNKNKKSKVNVSQCSRLIKPEYIDLTNFRNYLPESQDEITPRKKPNKYFGLPDDDPEDLSDFVRQKNYKVNNEEYLLRGIRPSITSSSSDNESTERESKRNTQTTRLKRRKTTTKNVDILKLKSDYETEERK